MQGELISEKSTDSQLKMKEEAEIIDKFSITNLKEIDLSSSNLTEHLKNGENKEEEFLPPKEPLEMLAKAGLYQFG